MQAHCSTIAYSLPFNCTQRDYHTLNAHMRVSTKISLIKSSYVRTTELSSVARLSQSYICVHWISPSRRVRYALATKHRRKFCMKWSPIFLDGLDWSVKSHCRQLAHWSCTFMSWISPGLKKLPGKKLHVHENGILEFLCNYLEIHLLHSVIEDVQKWYFKTSVYLMDTVFLGISRMRLDLYQLFCATTSVLCFYNHKLFSSYHNR